MRHPFTCHFDCILNYTGRWYMALRAKGMHSGWVNQLQNRLRTYDNTVLIRAVHFEPR